MLVTKAYQYKIRLNMDDLVRLLDGPAPDIEVTRAGQTVAPDVVLITWERRDRESWSFSQVTTSGYRKLANGGLGRERRSWTGYSFNRSRWPDWVKVLVDSLGPVQEET
jgi:hypothetical protein